MQCARIFGCKAVKRALFMTHLLCAQISGPKCAWQRGTLCRADCAVLTKLKMRCCLLYWTSGKVEYKVTCGIVLFLRCPVDHMLTLATTHTVTSLKSRKHKWKKAASAAQRSKRRQEQNMQAQGGKKRFLMTKKISYRRLGFGRNLNKIEGLPNR